MDIKQIKELMQLLEKSKLKKITVKEKNGFEISLEKDSEHSFSHDLANLQRQVLSHPAPHVSPSMAVSHVSHAEKPKEEKHHEHAKYITSPMVGTFYRSSGPGQSAFVKVGDKVDKGTVVCIIEAMKVMNEVKAGTSGVIKELLVENNHPVEFGTKLFVIE